MNIEIKGASHYDYVRNDDKLSWWRGGVIGVVGNAVDWFLSADDRAWNKEVSDFTARLISHSMSKEDVDAFLTSLGSSLAHFDPSKKVWIITLPGSEGRS